MIKFHCPHCDQRISAPNHFAGTQVECPACQQSFELEQAPDVPPTFTPTLFTPSASAPPPHPQPVTPPPLPKHWPPLAETTDSNYALGATDAHSPTKPRGSSSTGWVIAVLICGLIPFCTRWARDKNRYEERIQKVGQEAWNEVLDDEARRAATEKILLRDRVPPASPATDKQLDNLSEEIKRVASGEPVTIPRSAPPSSSSLPSGGLGWKKRQVAGLALDTPLAFGPRRDFLPNLPPAVRELTVSLDAYIAMDSGQSISVLVNRGQFNQEGGTIELDPPLRTSMSMFIAGLGPPTRPAAPVTYSSTTVDGRQARRASFRTIIPQGPVCVESVVFRKGPIIWDIKIVFPMESSAPDAERVIKSIQITES